MTAGPAFTPRAARWIWWLAFGVIALYVAARMGVFTLSVDVATPAGSVRLPNTYASVDHPFHVARAETLWRELASGNIPRWMGHHQGGYPVEFYPLGEAWLEVIVRALSLGSLSAEGAHTLAVVSLFLLPGLAYAAMATVDDLSPAVALVAFALHLSLPGSWYHGGYTELVQWGLVTNVAGAVAALLMLPALIRFLRRGEGWIGAAAAFLAAWAVYCNPRSVVGLAALGAGAWLAVVLGRLSLGIATVRLASISVLAALLAAPLLVALARFGHLYEFVRYSGYDDVAAYVSASVGAVTWSVIALGVVGLPLGLFVRRRAANTSAAIALVLYVALTLSVSFVPLVSGLAPQLEPTRLMPLQRLLTIYLASVAIWLMLDWLVSTFAKRRTWTGPLAAATVAVAIVVVQTRPPEIMPDPASPAVPPASLYPVAMSAQPRQFDLEVAVRAADERVLPGTAILVLGSALSWHQQLWAPLWTQRSLFYDNWLWSWHPNHAGTPGYRFLGGNHYPDPERALEPGYLTRHGIGAIVVTGPARAAASVSPLLEQLRSGMYDVYAVRDPVTIVTFGNENAALIGLGNENLNAVAETPGAPIVARVNWHPRWDASADDRPAPVGQRNDGYLAIEPGDPARTAELTYDVQPLDWAARILAAVGLAGLVWLLMSSFPRESDGRGWYARRLAGDAGSHKEL